MKGLDPDGKPCEIVVTQDATSIRVKLGAAECVQKDSDDSLSESDSGDSKELDFSSLTIDQSGKNFTGGCGVTKSKFNDGSLTILVMNGATPNVGEACTLK